MAAESSVLGKTVIITGASRGIGAATGTYLAAQGANVVLCARNAESVAALAAEIVASGGAATSMGCDVAQYGQVAAVVALADECFGPVDVLINNAGLIDPISRLATSDPAAWSTVVDVNLKGVYNGMRAVLPGMEARGAGTIINISSGAATGALEGWSHYCATKAGVLSLTKCGHKEHGDQGVTVVGLSPGTVATDMQREIKASGINPVSQIDFADHIPPEYVARAIAYLCGPGAAQYAGIDFSIKTPEGRAAVGLPPA